jgi:hypothetical protein
VRNIQLFYGCAFQKTATGLCALASQPPWGGTGTAPTVSTVSGFQKGFFVGIRYNLSGLVQTLFGGGAPPKDNRIGAAKRLARREAALPRWPCLSSIGGRNSSSSDSGPKLLRSARAAYAAVRRFHRLSTRD